MSNELKQKQNDFIDSVNKQFDALRCSIIETINNEIPKGLLNIEYDRTRYSML